MSRARTASTSLRLVSTPDVGADQRLLEPLVNFVGLGVAGQRGADPAEKTLARATESQTDPDGFGAPGGKFCRRSRRGLHRRLRNRRSGRRDRRLHRYGFRCNFEHRGRRHFDRRSRATTSAADGGATSRAVASSAASVSANWAAAV